jgi:plastocyanin
MRSVTLLTALALAAVAGCGGDSGSDTTTGPPSSNPPPANTVTVNNNFFSPATITVTPGTTVTWQWASGAVDHNVTFDDGEHSATQSSGTFARTFSAAGTFPYHCTIHGSLGMTGTVTVSASSSSGSGGGGGGGSGMGGGGGGGYDY